MRSLHKLFVLFGWFLATNGVVVTSIFTSYENEMLVEGLPVPVVALPGKTAVVASSTAVAVSCDR